MEIKIPNIESFLDPTKEYGEDASLNLRVEEMCYFDILIKNQTYIPSIILNKQQILLLRDSRDLIIKNNLMEEEEND